MEKSRKVLQKIKSRTTTCPSNPTSGPYPKEMKSRSERDSCTPTFAAAGFTRAKTWKQPKGPPTHERIKTIWCIYTMRYYSVTKGKSAIGNNTYGSWGRYAKISNTRLRSYLCAEPKKNPNSQKQQMDRGFPQAGEGSGQTGKVVKRYKLPIWRQISSGDITHA